MLVVNNKMMRMFKAATEFVCSRGEVFLENFKAICVLKGKPSGIQVALNNFFDKIVAVAHCTGQVPAPTSVKPEEKHAVFALNPAMA